MQILLSYIAVSLQDENLIFVHGISFHNYKLLFPSLCVIPVVARHLLVYLKRHTPLESNSSIFGVFVLISEQCTENCLFAWKVSENHQSIEQAEIKVWSKLSLCSVFHNSGAPAPAEPHKLTTLGIKPIELKSFGCH